MITIICGKPGYGKTSFMAYLAMLEMTIKSRDSYINACNEIFTLNSQGLCLQLPPYKHLTYANFWVESHIWGYSPRIAMDFDGTDFGLPDRDHMTKFIPPYSSIFLMEGQSFLDSRKSRFFRQSVSRAYEIHRHYDLNIYLDCQRSTLIDLNVRGISEKLIEVYKHVNVIKDRQGRVLKVVWFLREFSSTEEYDKYLESGSVLKNYTEYSIVYTGNIFKCYNTKQNRALFYSNILSSRFCYDLIQKPCLELSYILDFNRSHSLSNMKNNAYWQKGV